MRGQGISIPKATVTFSDAQIEWLNETATAHSTSVSDIIRRLVDETRGAYLTPPKARLRTALLASSDEATS